MNNPKGNPFLKQLVANIASKATIGRTPDLSWGVLAEARKKKSVKEGNMAPKKEKKDNTEERPADEIPADDVGPAGTNAQKGNPDLGASSDKSPDLPPLSKDGEAAPVDSQTGPEEPTESPAPEENTEEAEAEATQAKAELEKVKAEKDQAEKEIKKHSYVHLVSQSGVNFLLAKLVDHAFKTNTIDSLASEMTGKLKMQTPEDFTNFTEEMAPYRGIPGVAELLASMKNMATKKPDADAEEEPVS